MTDSLKLAEMQRTRVDFERQRHLANWFIKSSPHMATSTSSHVNSTNIANNNKPQKSSSCQTNGTIANESPMFFIVSGQKNLAPQHLSANLPLSRSQIFTSQSNLPYKMATSSAQEGRKPKLRRFNSHDTNTNIFSVADFENARLARRNEIEMRQRLQQRLKMNSLSSGGDCSTGGSKTSKYSNDFHSQADPLSADIFLERYSLPRVVRISHKQKFSHETMQSTSSSGSSTNSASSLPTKSVEASKNNSELYLLYRYLRQRKIYHGHHTKAHSVNRKKGIKIPQEFPGYFSLINDKGTPTATMYTVLVQLVRERVYKFISVDNLPAFAESQNTEGVGSRPHYIKSTARGGQVFRLLAVFEDGKDNSTSNNRGSYSIGREKEKGRYAQLLNENRQILYVPLSAKGKFYEVEQSIPQLLQKTSTTNEIFKAINIDCVHRISNLIVLEANLPINVRFISGPVGSTNTIPENLTIERVSTEDVLIACPIDNIESQTPLYLTKLHVSPELFIVKFFLGFENEQRMLANPNVQNVLKFCQFNCEAFIKMIEQEILNSFERSTGRNMVEGLRMLKPLNIPKLLKREKSVIAHEKEDSIIFLSKNDLANLSSKEEKPTNQNQISEKMKVFQPKKKKWFRKNEKDISLFNVDIDMQTKRTSMERYNDMSKLLQERFGAFENQSVNKRPISELGCSDNSACSYTIQRSISLQDVEFLDKPDLLPPNSGSRSKSNLDINDEFKIDSCFNNEGLEDKPVQQSFISEKMYSEFHVKTRQYSKSSSSLHQLLHFAVSPRNNSETRKQPKYQNKTENCSLITQYELNQQEISANLNLKNVANINVDDLPYSSVRDSLLIPDSSVEERSKQRGIIFQQENSLDQTMENIYAEICHDGGAVSRIQINMVNPSNGTDSTVQQLETNGATCSDNIYNTLS